MSEATRLLRLAKQLTGGAGLGRGRSDYGAESLLNNALGLEPDTQLPLHLPHGVDFSQYDEPLDIKNVAPIHWCCTPENLDAAAGFKQAVLLPHAFRLASLKLERPAHRGTLVVGPPPGPVNDMRLFECLTAQFPGPSTILVKPRAGWERSIAFWESRNYPTITFAQSGPVTYGSMAEILSGYDTLICPTVSSAAFFGAALGLNVRWVQGYVYEVVEAAQDWTASFAVPRGRELVRRMMTGSANDCTETARYVLGWPLGTDAEHMSASLMRAMTACRRPVHAPAYPDWLNPVVASVARRTGRVSFLSRGVTGSLKAMIGRGHLIKLSIDEVGLYRDGVSSANLRMEPIAGSSRTRNPGEAFEIYGDG